MQTAFKYVIAALIGFVAYSAISGWGYIANEAKGGTSPGYQITAIVVGLGIFVWLVTKIK